MVFTSALLNLNKEKLSITEIDKYSFFYSKIFLLVETNSLKLKIADNGTDWLKISWSIPGSDCVTKTVIKYCRDYQCEETNVTQTFYNATNLLPCTTYNFTVTFYGESEEFGSTDIIGVTGYLSNEIEFFQLSYIQFGIN